MPLKRRSSELDDFPVGLELFFLGVREKALLEGIGTRAFKKSASLSNLCWPGYWRRR